MEVDQELHSAFDIHLLLWLLAYINVAMAFRVNFDSISNLFYLSDLIGIDASIEVLDLREVLISVRSKGEGLFWRTCYNPYQVLRT